MSIPMGDGSGSAKCNESPECNLPAIAVFDFTSAGGGYIWPCIKHFGRAAQRFSRYVVEASQSREN